MITLHIQDEYIRVMVTDGRQVLQVAKCSLEKGLVESGLIVEKSIVSQLIKELLAANAISEKQVITGISGVHTMYRTVTLPRLAKNMVGEAARHELERAMPVPLNESPYLLAGSRYFRYGNDALHGWIAQKHS